MNVTKFNAPHNLDQLSTHERILRRTSEIIERNRQLTALNMIASSVSQSLNFNEILTTAIEHVLHLMEFEAGWIALLDRDAECLLMNAAQGLSEQLMRLIERLHPDEAFIGAVARTGQPLIGEIPTSSGDRVAQQLRREGFSFCVVIPLKAKGKTLGIMGLCCRRLRLVDRNSSDFLSSVGDVIGVAIENATLYQNIARLAEQLKQQSDQLQASEHKYRSLIENAKDAVILIQDGRIQYANQSAADISGYTLDELHRLDDVLILLREQDREPMRQQCEQLLQGGDAPTFDIVARRKDGQEVSLEVRGSLIEYNGRPAVQYIIRDVTEQKILREQVVRSEKMAALGQLISGVAHELNNPLTVMIGYSELLGMEKNLTGSVRQGLEVIQEAARRAGKIVQNLLTFARQHKAAHVGVNINELIERTVALREYELNVNNIEVVKELTPDLPQTVADPHQLQQVFLNLIMNAEQAMLEAHGRGRLMLRTRLKPSPPGTRPSNNPVIEITIADDGPGILPENLHRIFEPFFTTKPVGKGTGLGLSVSHTIIQNHGGHIYVQSEPGRGATFIIELPIVRESAEQGEPKVELPPKKEVSPKDVLIIDDEPGILNLLRQIVRDEGHRPETATSGAHALEKLRKKDYDLIFCDIKMPHMDGQELYREIKTRNGALARKIIFVTGDVVSPQTREFLKQSNSRFLEKPFINEEVIRIIRDALADDS